MIHLLAGFIRGLINAAKLDSVIPPELVSSAELFVLCASRKLDAVVFLPTDHNLSAS